MRINSFILFIVALSVSINSLAQKSEVETAISSAINKYGRQFIKDKNIRSASIGVLKNGQSFTQHFGELDTGKNNPPTDETIYEIASVTKTMVGYLVAKAVEEGKISLEDDIRKYLGDGYPNLEYNGNVILIRHLLTHTGGLPGFLPKSLDGIFEKMNPNTPEKFYQVSVAVSREQFLEDLKDVQISTIPGTEYRYSNAGTELIGYILEKVYMADLSYLLETRLFSENGMSDSFMFDKDREQQVVRGYWMNNTEQSPYFISNLWGSSANVKSTLADLMRYAKLQLDTKDDIISKSHEVLYFNGKTLRVGFFWRVWKDKYGTSYNHHGGTGGVQNWLYIFPEFDMAISIITNHSGPKTPSKLSKAARNLLKDIARIDK